MNFELSNYQKDILNYVKSTNNNLLIDAKAGSGKTSTLILIAEELLNANQNCLFLSFNKSIVDELKLKIPELSSNIKTVHSLGLTFIRSYLYKKHNTNYVIKDMDLSKKKVRELVKMYYEKYFAKEIAEYHQELSEQELKDTHYEIITDFVNVCNYARLYCCDFTDKKQIEHITLKFARRLPEYIDDVLPNYYELVPAVINAVLNMFEHPEKNMEGKYEYAIDFLDMIYLPVQYSMNVPFSIRNSLDTVLVDECIPEVHFVETEYGKMKFKELKRRIDKGECIKVKTFNEKTEQFEFKNVINIVDKGVKPVYEITTTGLNKIQATDNHPFMTQNGWKQLKDLEVGKDYLYLDKPSNQKTKYIPNDDQLQLILGSALGDGSLQKVSNNDYEFRIKFTQGENQLNYLKFKQQMLCCKEPHILRSGYTHKDNIYTTNSKVFLLPYNSKIEFINHLDLRGLAVLYMDDGSKLSKYDYSGTHISCNSFNLDETNALISKLKEFGINSTNVPCKRNNKVYNELHIDSDNAKIFFEKIAPYMHTDCYYKNPLSTGKYKWNSNWKLFGGNIIKSIQYVGEQKVLDMEVEDNHNFLISKFYQKGGSSILVHNCQDLSLLQQMFIRRLYTGSNRFIFVGDRNQCQPAGTKILMADLTEKNIEDIKVGDMVVSYDTKASYFRQQTTRCKGNKVLETKRLKTDGYYNVILDNGKSSNYTYNHKCYARINTDIGYITYIMGTVDGKFRIGHTRLFNNNSKINGFGLRMRMRQENCKYGWVLSYHKDKESAYMEEQLLSYKYQIPQCIFTDGNTHKIPRNNIEWFYNNFGYENIKNNVIKCLKDYGRSIDYPFVIVDDYKRHITRKSISVYETCNLLPEIMEFVYFDENNKKRHYRNKCNVVGASFSKIKSITYKQDECYVYCLKIDKLENYVADKILTHNCIYGFSGADTKAVDRIKDNFRPRELPLSICYRCPEKVVRLAREIVPTIEWNKDRLDTGTLKTIDYTDMRDNISQGEIIIGRRNKDLLKIYKDFTFNLKREIKFRNKDLVNAIEKDLLTCIRDYMLLYAKNLNMDKYVMTVLNEFAAINNIPVNSNLYKTEKETITDKYIKEHKNDKREVMKSNQTLEYLIKCMQEYHDEGAYAYEEDNILTVYYDIILDFINIYKQNHASVLVNDFMEYMKNFLNASLNKYNVPIISSVHSMKGGEADTVYIYDYPKFPYKRNSMTKDEIQQEKNLQYVAITRAKKNLYLVLCDTSTAKSPEQSSFIQTQNQECIEHIEEINKLVDDLKASKYNQ